MGFGVAFDLSDLDYRLPFVALSRRLGRKRSPPQAGLIKHVPFGDIRVVGDRDEFGAGSL